MRQQEIEAGRIIYFRGIPCRLNESVFVECETDLKEADDEESSESRASSTSACGSSSAARLGESNAV